MKVCLDTNVLVSALTTRGLSADVMRLVLTEHELVLPAVVLAELDRILATKFRLAAADHAAALEFFADVPTVPKPRRSLAAPSIRDPADAWVLASAVAGQAAVLISGDKDLLDVAAQAPIEICTPRAFYEAQRTR